MRERWRTLTGSVPRRRATTGILAIAALTVAAGLGALTLGRLGVPLGDLPAVLTGGGTRAQRVVLTVLRLPRLGVAVGAGAALAVAGAIFQSVTRNPLGSPDVIGLGAGAAAGAAAAGLVWPGLVPVAVGATIGAVAATAVVWFGAGAGTLAPYRMVLIGVGVAAMALAFVQYALSRARLQDAQRVDAWLFGSLDGRSARDAAMILFALGALLPTALVLSRHLKLLEMGDDAASGVGVAPGRTRLAAVAVGVGLTAAAVVVSGPVSFVALAAPQIARRVTGSAGPGIAAAAVTGSGLLVLADLVAEQLPVLVGAPGRLPVGIVTAALGGVYLAGLLVRQWREGTM